MFLLYVLLKLTRTQYFDNYLFHLRGFFDLGYEFGSKHKHVVYDLEKHKMLLYVHQSIKLFISDSIINKLRHNYFLLLL